MKHLQGRNVLVLGLGASGLAMARWCARHGAQVQVWDSREQPPMLQALKQEWPQIPVLSGELSTDILLDMHLLLKSPGLAPHDARVAPLLQAARADRITVQGELDLFQLALDDLKTSMAYQPAVLAITGTNGKTTTAALTALLVQRCNRRVALAGNIGPTLLDTLAAALDELARAEAGADPLEQLPQVWVLELSSFQLDAVQRFEPTAAVVLNITQDHLDWHGDMPSYVRSKSRIYGHEPITHEDGRIELSETVMVINRDDERVAAMEPAPIAVKGSRGKAATTLSRHTLGFSLHAPQRPGDFGLIQEGGMAWLVRAHPQETEGDRRSRAAAQEPAEIFVQRLMPADALRIRGRHNAANALAALALSVAIGCPLAPMLHGLREYAGEPHRVSFVARVAEVEAFDDSKGTNVGATVAAITGLGQDREPSKLVLLMGGDGKGQDFSPLLDPVARHARAVALYGRDAGALEEALRPAGVPLALHGDLQSATDWAFTQAHPGDAVLLSPACASLDQFRDYRHRAEVFVAAVQSRLAQEGGLA